MNIAPNKQRAITALLAGASNQDAAKAAGVAPATLCRWKHLPDFARELDNGQTALADATKSDLAALREKALGAIADALDNEEVNIRLRAAALVMPRNGAPITVNANAQANAAAVVMPELSMEDAVAHILAGPRTLMRAIGAGVLPDTPELRTRRRPGADDWPNALAKTKTTASAKHQQRIEPNATDDQHSTVDHESTATDEPATPLALHV